jgi:transposase
MHAMTVGVDLAKTRFELAIADEGGRIRERHRLTRSGFARFFSNRPRCRIFMEACGSAHHWARTLQSQGHEVQLLPAQYVRAWVRRNKTDAADAAALIQAGAWVDIPRVPIKSIEQQQIQQLHRLREQLKRTRTARINALRGLMREFGVSIAVGLVRGLRQMREALQTPDVLPARLCPFIAQTLTEIEQLTDRMEGIERELVQYGREDQTIARLQQIPGIGPLGASALRTAIGDIQRFPSGRHLASWLGLTAREHSSGERRRLGGMSKQGDVYLRTLLVHGARSALRAAHRARSQGRPLDRLRRWALDTDARCGRNKATVALANKIARIAWATWRHERPFQANWLPMNAVP